MTPNPDLPVATDWIELAPGFEGFLARPPAGHGPGLVLLQEIFGVNAHIRAVCEQYAASGFVVLAPDVFWRRRPRVELGYDGADRDRALALMQALQPAEVEADLATAVAALRARPEVRASTAGQRVGALGYCLGGRLAYVAAATAGVDAAVAFYGGGIDAALGLAPRIGCPIQFHWAGDDPHIPPEAVQRVHAAFDGHRAPAEFHVYPSARHGFNCWARASHHAPSAALAQGRALAFLAAALFDGG